MVVVSMTCKAETAPVKCNIPAIYCIGLTAREVLAAPTLRTNVTLLAGLTDPTKSE